MSLWKFYKQILHIVSLNKNRPISMEKTSKGWLFFIITDAKSFMKRECSVSHSSAMTHPYKWAKAGALSVKNIFSTVYPSYNELWRDHGILLDIITVQKWLENLRKLRFSQFYILFLYCVGFPASPN